MNRKWIYTLSLIGFFLMWGVFGFMAAAPRTEPVTQSAILPAADTQLAPAVTPNAVIPVTGEAKPVRGILLIYALSALGALFLILALLNAANKRTVPYATRKEPPDQS